MRWSLEPQIRLMKAVLAANEVGDDLESMLAADRGALQTTRLSKLWRWCSRDGLFHKCMQQCHHILVDDTLWSSHDYTEQVAGQISRYILRTASLVHEIMLKCQMFPVRLFGILEGADAGAIIRDAAFSPCLVDSFTATFLGTFGTEEALASQEARLALQAIGGHAYGNIHSTERLHSSHSRRARTRSQTHKMRLDQVSLRHHGRVAPKWHPRKRDQHQKE